MTTIETSTKIRAYSTIPCPSWRTGSRCTFHRRANITRIPGSKRKRSLLRSFLIALDQDPFHGPTAESTVSTPPSAAVYGWATAMPEPPQDARSRLKESRRTRLGLLALAYASVIVPAVVDVIAIVAGGPLGSSTLDLDCGPGGWGVLFLVPVPIAFAAGGITTLWLAQRRAQVNGTGLTELRALGFTAVVLAAVSIPANFLFYLYWLANCGT
jgi:hypothetical protein